MASSNDNTVANKVLQKFMVRGKPVNILITGKTGAGKSSLVNAVIGNVSAIEGRDLKGVTRLVKKHSIQINSVDFNIWDSPGFQDITESDAAIANRITTQLKRECTDIHLLLYCLRIDTDRLQRNDELAIMQLTDIFGPEIWKTSVIALTFANKVTPPPNMDTDELAPIYFNQRLGEYKSELIKILEKCHMNAEDAAKIAVIPIGYHQPTRSISNPYILPDRKDWFNPFWITCADRMKETALALLLISQRDRIKLIETKDQKPANNNATPDKPNFEPSNKHVINIEEKEDGFLFKKFVFALGKIGVRIVRGFITIAPFL